MKKLQLLSLLSFLFIATSGIAKNSKGTKMVGGAEMYPTKNIVENAVNSKDHTTLVAAVKAADIVNAIKKGNGKATFKTVSGADITAMMDGKNVKVKDAAGNVATVTIADVNQSNGVIHVIDTVLLPTK